MARDPSPAVKVEADDAAIDALFKPDEQEAYFVVLNVTEGTPAPGVYAQRPPNTALGKHLDLLPIVVICSDKREAWTIHQLNQDIISRLLDPTDVLELRRAIMRSHFVRTELMKETRVPYYALKVAQETGIYHGFDWKDQIQPLTSFKSPRFKKFCMFGNALLWMLDKAALAPQFNTHVSGARLFGVSPGRSPSPVKQGDRADTRTAGEQSISAAPAQRGSSVALASATTRARSTSPVKARDPVRSSTPGREVSNNFAVASGGTPCTPRKARAQFPPALSRSQSAALSPGRARSGHTWPLGDSSIVVDVSDDECQGEDQMSSPLIDHLRRIVRPAALSTGDFAPTFNLGPHADVWMSARRLGIDKQVSLLQAFIWSANATEFCMSVGRPPVELSVADAQYVWGLLSTWVASLGDI